MAAGPGEGGNSGSGPSAASAFVSQQTGAQTPPPWSPSSAGGGGGQLTGWQLAIAIALPVALAGAAFAAIAGLAVTRLGRRRALSFHAQVHP